MSITLKRLNLLAIDCQTSGNSPKTGHLLEMGWTVFSADTFGAPESPVPTTRLIRQPPGFVLPARIQKLTGIKTAHLENAASARQTLEALEMAAEKVAKSGQLSLCPTVIHYARFEMAFLKQLHKRLKQNRPLPLDVICTHHLASRLFPELPRKGLRAVAGYLGHSVPALKRCNAHIRATAYIWARMVHLLADQKNIHTLDQLHQWLGKPAVSVQSKVYPMPRQIRLGVPDAPGIYRMKRPNADVLYIGKAASLKQRVNSYFQKGRRHSENTLEMLTQAVDVDFITTPTALEAALLESDAIKSCKPPYNIALTGDHRNLFFISRDFSKHSADYDNTCPHGPVPSIDPYVAAHELGTYLHYPTAREWDICKIMAMPERHCPDVTCIKAGLSIFQQCYGQRIAGKTIHQAIVHIGRLSWLEMYSIGPQGHDLS
jgi:DNA polymerase-3 subunit epsilon